MLTLIGIGFIAMFWFSSRSRQETVTQQEERRRTLAEKLVPGAWVHTVVGFWGHFADEDGDVIILETSDGTEMHWDRQVIREVGVEPPFVTDEDEELDKTESDTPILGTNDPETSTDASENKRIPAKRDTWRTTVSTRKRRPVCSLATLIVTMLAAVAAFVIGNTTGGTLLAPSLALDLQGGTQLVLRPTFAQAGERAITEEDFNQVISIIRNRIDVFGVSESKITSMDSENIAVLIPGIPSQETLNLIRSSSQMNSRPVLQTGVARTSAAALKQAEANASGNGAQPEVQSGDEASQSDPSTQDSIQSVQSGESADSAQSDEMISTVFDEANAMTLADCNQDGVLSDTFEPESENVSSPAWVTEQAFFDFYTLDYMAQVSNQEGPTDKPFTACDENGSIKYILGPVTVVGANLDTVSAGQITNSTGQMTGQ